MDILTALFNYFMTGFLVTRLNLKKGIIFALVMCPIDFIFKSYTNDFYVLTYFVVSMLLIYILTKSKLGLIILFLDLLLEGVCFFLALNHYWVYFILFFIIKLKIIKEPKFLEEIQTRTFYVIIVSIILFGIYFALNFIFERGV